MYRVLRRIGFRWEQGDRKYLQLWMNELQKGAQEVGAEAGGQGDEEDVRTGGTLPWSPDVFSTVAGMGAYYSAVHSHAGQVSFTPVTTNPILCKHLRTPHLDTQVSL